MLIQKRFYKWDDQFSDLPIKLGQEKAILIEKGIIAQVIKEGEEEEEWMIKDHEGSRVKITEKLVTGIAFYRPSKIAIHGVEVIGKFHSEINDHLDRRFESIEELNNDSQSQSSYTLSDLMVILYGDAIASFVMIIKKKKPE
ncbi:MAG: hypothetical protein AAF502_19305 [Bacteroidota bacterium]